MMKKMVSVGLYVRISETVEERFHSPECFIKVLSGDRVCTAQIAFASSTENTTRYNGNPMLCQESLGKF